MRVFFKLCELQMCVLLFSKSLKGEMDSLTGKYKQEDSVKQASI